MDMDGVWGGSEEIGFGDGHVLLIMDGKDE